MKTIKAAIDRWRQGRRIHNLCERFRAGMAAAGERESAKLDDTAILIGLKELVESRPESRGRSPVEIVTATIRALEGTVYALENPIEIPIKGGKITNSDGSTTTLLEGNAKVVTDPGIRHLGSWHKGRRIG